MSGVSGARSAGNVSSPAVQEREHPVMNALSNPTGKQQHRADAAREQLARCRTVDLSSHTLGHPQGLRRRSRQMKC